MASLAHSSSRPIVSAEGFVDAGCTTIISKETCGIWMPEGSWVPLYLRQRTFWLRGRLQESGQVQVLPIAGVRREPGIKALPTVAETLAQPLTPRPAAAQSSTDDWGSYAARLRARSGAAGVEQPALGAAAGPARLYAEPPPHLRCRQRPRRSFRQQPLPRRRLRWRTTLSSWPTTSRTKEN